MLASRCHLDNGNTPQEPALVDSEKAGTRIFLKEILKILHLAGLRAFEAPKAIASPENKSAMVQTSTTPATELDTIVIPAQQDGFQKVFIGEQCWYAIRISGGMLQKIKWIAAYQSSPVSAVTHVAPVARIEPYGEGGKYRVVFSEPPKEIKSIPYGNAPSGSMQGPRYTTFQKLMAATSVQDLVSR